MGHHMNRRASCHDLQSFLACLVLTVVPAACAGRYAAPISAELKHFEYSQIHMGVRARIVLYAVSDAKAAEAARAAFARIAVLDAMMSDYRSDSELMRLCNLAGTGPVAVSDELFEVLTFAKTLHEQSGGAFDVTAGPVVRLWREMRRSGMLASQEAIAAARDLVGSQWMHLDDDAQTVELRKAGMRLDLGGVAKGYACDAAAEVLRVHGIDRYLVSLAGDIVVGQAPPDRRAWEVMIEAGVHPVADEAMPALQLVNAAVSTSGDAKQFVEIEGVRYSHIVDPRTGLGSPRRIAATVMAPRGMTADALATALCLLPPEVGLGLVSRYSGAAAQIEEATAQGATLHTTGRMKSVP